MLNSPRRSSKLNCLTEVRRMAQISNMIHDSGTSSSDIQITDSNHIIKRSKAKILYLGIMCFATNCLSSIALEAGLRGSFRSISPTRFVIYNNLFRRNYNLRIKIMVANVLAAFVSTIMLTIGDVYGIPYLYLPWLINTIEGIIFYEGPTLFGLMYTVLPNANMPAGLFVFITLLLYVVELYFWKDIFVNFGRCWTKYNADKMLEAKRLAEAEDKESYAEDKESLDLVSGKSNNLEEPMNPWNEFVNHNITGSATKSVRNNFSTINYNNRDSFIEVTG